MAQTGRAPRPQGGMQVPGRRSAGREIEGPGAPGLPNIAGPLASGAGVRCQARGQRPGGNPQRPTRSGLTHGGTSAGRSGDHPPPHVHALSAPLDSAMHASRSRVCAHRAGRVAAAWGGEMLSALLLLRPPQGALAGRWRPTGGVGVAHERPGCLGLVLGAQHARAMLARRSARRWRPSALKTLSRTQCSREGGLQTGCGRTWRPPPPVVPGVAAYQ